MRGVAFTADLNPGRDPATWPQSELQIVNERVDEHHSDRMEKIPAGESIISLGRAARSTHNDAAFAAVAAWATAALVRGRGAACWAA